MACLLSEFLAWSRNSTAGTKVRYSSTEQVLVSYCPFDRFPVLRLFRKKVAYVFGIIVYLTVTIPSLRAIADQTAEEIYSDQVMALRVLSAGNIIIIGSLLLILALQVSGLIGKNIFELSVDRCAGWTGMGTSARSQRSC